MQRVCFAELKAEKAHFSLSQPLKLPASDLSFTSHGSGEATCGFVGCRCLNRTQTDLIAGELHSGVVLDLPQTLVETFPLVGLAEFVFILFVRQKIFRT